ncbi:MAG: excisionase family DNA-binding protein [Exiguobacterium sp.]|nr:excisionase family DNA-binding protein [Exiguobacterium sp.]
MYSNRKEWEADIISLTEAAELLNVSRQRVHILLQNGQLEGFKVGNTWNVYKSSVDSRLSNR